MRFDLAKTALVVATSIALPFVASAQDAAVPALGTPLTEAELAGLSTTVFPDGEGLPDGSGTVADGAVIYEEQCSFCHAETGRGDMSMGVPGVAGDPTYGVDWTTGSAWPYAPSIFDYVRRGMPPYGPKLLSDDEVYAVTAYMLHLHGLLDEGDNIDKDSLAAIEMPGQAISHSKWAETESSNYP